MSDLLIKGGTVVDGTGARAYKADVRVSGAAIVEIGPDLTPCGERVVDAAGCYVTPGFIESHTHFDGTMWWQNDLSPLPGYGATTIVMGNCGFSPAPVSDDPSARLEMVKIFSFFEDIPEEPFINDVPWDWRTWSEYKASLTSKVKVPANYGAFVGHIAIRLAVMGLDAWTRAATSGEIDEMCELLDDALKAGALGLSSNLHDHDGDDRPVPSLLADDAEFDALLAVLDRHPGTSLQIIVDTFMRLTAPESVDRIARLLEGKNVRVQWAGGVPNLAFQAGIRDQMVQQQEAFKAKGYDFWAGYAHVPPTSTISLIRSLIFAQSNDYVWHEVVLAESDEEKLRLLKDPAWRARARESWDNKAWAWSPMNTPHDMFLRNSDNGHGPVGLTLADLAARRGVHRSDALADWFIDNGVRSTVHMAPLAIDEDLTLQLLKDPLTVGNISDAGAHGQMFCGAGENMILFTKYVRGGLLTIEEAVHVQTGKLAAFFNLADRGVIAVGKRADIAVFNLDEIERREEEKVFDVPDGRGGVTWRYSRQPAPMRLTLVNGVPTFEYDQATGATPGEFIAPDAARPMAAPAG